MAQSKPSKYGSFSPFGDDEDRVRRSHKAQTGQQYDGDLHGDGLDSTAPDQMHLVDPMPKDWCLTAAHRAAFIPESPAHEVYGIRSLEPVRDIALQSGVIGCISGASIASSVANFAGQLSSSCRLSSEIPLW